MDLYEITVTVDMSQVEPILTKLYARIEELTEENERLKEKITDLEGLPLHS